MQRPQLWRRYTVVAVVGLGLVLVQVWARLQVVAVGYQLSNTQELIHSLEGERQALEMQWSALTAPSHLAGEAEKRLGMSVAQPQQVVRMP
jgi:cell division protein FtsL